MKMTLPCSVTALLLSHNEELVSVGMSTFLAEQLLPLMAGNWPASANQLDANARGVAMAWGSMLKGFTPKQIRDVVMELAEDVDRPFAPRPAEVRAVILKRTTKPIQMAFSGPSISMRACEMEAVVRVYVREQSVTVEEVSVELKLVFDEKRDDGVVVKGR